MVLKKICALISLDKLKSVPTCKHFNLTLACAFERNLLILPT